MDATPEAARSDFWFISRFVTVISLLRRRWVYGIHHHRVSAPDPIVFQVQLGCLQNVLLLLTETKCTVCFAPGQYASLGL